MKRIKYIALSLAFMSCISCSTTASDESSSDEYGLKTMAARGDGNDAVISTDNNNSENTLEITAGSLTAGQWKDLDNWGFWQSLMQKEMYFNFQSQWSFFPTQRYSVQLSDKNGNPVHDAEVVLLDKNNKKVWSSKSNNNGVAELWAQPFAETKMLEGNKIEILQKDKKHLIDKPTTFAQGINKFELPQVAAEPANIAEVMLVVDATGSMEDEIAYMRKELEDVVSQVKTKRPEMTLNLGALFYRDQGDEYVTKASNLSADASSVINFMNQQSADGGGDYPEAVDVALDEALNQQSWAPSARTRIIFLMLDAPPHQDAASFKKLQNAIATASQKGVQLIPIASSGIDKDTEFLMRFMSMTTNGSYVFLTDHSGVGNEHMEPTIGEYRVEYLNDLLARIIVQSAETSKGITQ